MPCWCRGTSRRFCRGGGVRVSEMQEGGMRMMGTDRPQPAEAAAVAAHAMTQAGRADGLGAAGELAGAVAVAVELPWAATRAMRDERGTSMCMMVVVGIRRLSWSFFH